MQARRAHLFGNIFRRRDQKERLSSRATPPSSSTAERSASAGRAPRRLQHELRALMHDAVRRPVTFAPNG